MKGKPAALMTPGGRGRGKGRLRMLMEIAMKIQPLDTGHISTAFSSSENEWLPAETNDKMHVSRIRRFHRQWTSQRDDLRSPLSSTKGF